MPASQSVRVTRLLRFATLRCAAVAAAMLVLMLASPLSLAPAAAADRSYEISAVTIEAELAADGTLEVAESRIYSFDGEFNGVRQTVGLIGPGMRLEFEDASVRKDGSEQKLDVVAMDPAWRDDPASAPKGKAAFDPERATFYAFHAFRDEADTITFRYRIRGAGQLYADTAELYWKFVAEKWDVPNEFVQLRLKLPVPEDAQAVAGDNVLIYGHGPFDANIHLAEGGTVRAIVPEVAPGDFAETRILFPKEWLADVKAGSANAHDGTRRQAAIAEEESFVTAQEAEARAKRIYNGIGTGIIGAIVLAVIGLFRRFGKEYRPQFTEKYWRDVPDPNLHPAVVARLHAWGGSQRDIPVVLMRLAQLGAIQLVEVPDEQGRYGRHGDYAIIRTEAADGIALGPIDRAAMNLLFGTIGHGELEGLSEQDRSVRRVLDAMVESGQWRNYGSATGLQFDPVAAALVPAQSTHRDQAVLFGEFKARAKADPEDVAAAWDELTNAINEEVRALHVYEEPGKWLQIALWFLALFLAIPGVLFGAAFGTAWFWAALAAGTATIVACAWNMRRRTHAANEITAKCKALRRWLKDFSKLDEAPPSDVRKWGELMVYAAALGVADEALGQLRKAQPQIASDSDFLATGYWIGASSSMEDRGAPLDSLGTAVMETNAQVAESRDGGGGSFGGGDGGGFSDGGGGGFGGGGGGGAF